MKVTLKRSSDIKPLFVEIVNKGYIPLISSSYNILAGEGGSGKSLVALKSAIVYLIDNPQKKAFMFMTEDGILENKKRIKLICENMGHDDKSIEERILWYTAEEAYVPKLVFKENGNKLKDFEAIDSICEQAIIENVGFICFDPLRAFHELEENSNDDMPFLTREVFPSIGKKTGAVILVVHHSAKGDGSQVRGASSIGNDARIAWVVSKAVTKNKMTGKTTITEGMESKIHLSLYKTNTDAGKYCTIRDHDGMIDLPLVFKKKIEYAHEVIEYKEQKTEMGLLL